jgi:hypothetical protein
MLCFVISLERVYAVVGQPWYLHESKAVGAQPFVEELDRSVSFLIGFFLGIPFCEGMRKIGLPYEMTEQEGMRIVKNWTRYVYLVRNWTTG